MTQTLDLGPRVELISMDPHFHDITIALYSPGSDGQPAYLVHTYSSIPGADERLARLRQTMQTLGGMEATGEGLLHFPCGHAHPLAARRVFLDSCKLKPETPAEAQPLNIFDKKSDGTITVASLGNGLYEARPADDAQGTERRVATIARGLMRLGEMEEVDGQPNQTRFSCSQEHDDLIGLLLGRAPNVRAAMREAEDMASRGVLAAPSAQE